jgi:signal transduction histidine kinase/DNA-binding response OmpR family regulator
MERSWGIDLEGRVMRYEPWAVDEAGRYSRHETIRRYSPNPIGGEALRESLLFFEAEGGDSRQLIELLNRHAPKGFAIDRESLLDDSRLYGAEYYFYFTMFTKRLMNDFAFKYRSNDNPVLSKHHRYYERGKIDTVPWGIDICGNSVKGLALLNIAFPLRYIEEELGLEVEELVAWLNCFVEPSKAVTKDFFFPEVNAVQCSYEYVVIFLVLAEAYVNSAAIFEASFRQYVADGSKSLLADFLACSPKKAFEIFVAHRKALSDAYTDTITRRFFSVRLDIAITDRFYVRAMGEYPMSILELALLIHIGGCRGVLEDVMGVPLSLVKASCYFHDVDDAGFDLVFRPGIPRKSFISGLAVIVAAASLGFSVQAFLPSPYRAFAFVLLLCGLAGFLERAKLARDRVEAKLERVNEAFVKQFRLLKDSNEALIREKAGLEDKVSFRIAELARANERLKELDLAKTNLFYNISHELRTPLTLIKAPLASLRSGRFGQKVSVDDPIFDAMSRNCDRLHRQVNNLLLFAKIEQVKLRAVPRLVDLAKLLRVYISELESVATARGLELKSSLSDEPCMAFVDPELFEVAFFNLASNALKFTNPGGSVTIECLSEGDGALVAIEDTGVGIAAERLSGIFERFGQGDDGMNRRYEGTGIGLSLTKEVLFLMGGAVSVESELGRGSRFAMRLPTGGAFSTGGVEGLDRYVDASSSERRKTLLADVPTAIVDDEGNAAPAEPQPRARRNGRMKTILLVEDNVDLLDFLGKIFSDDYVALCARNGEEALDLLGRDRRINLVVSDIMMPGMDGKELLARMRKEERYAGLPFIFLTARASEEEKIESLGEGAIDYLVKPFRAEELLAKVEAALALREEGLKEAERRIKRALYEDGYSGGRDLEAELGRLGLSEGEFAVARVLVQGMSDKEIAYELKCSPRTVSNRVAAILHKFGARGRSDFIASLGKDR